MTSKIKDIIAALLISSAIIGSIALLQQDDDRAADKAQAEVSKRLSKLDYVEAANIRECMAKYGATDNVAVSIKDGVIKCFTKRGHLLGAL